jgi:hypothetical protein
MPGFGRMSKGLDIGDQALSVSEGRYTDFYNRLIKEAELSLHTHSGQRYLDGTLYKGEEGSEQRSSSV